MHKWVSTRWLLVATQALGEQELEACRGSCVQELGVAPGQSGVRHRQAGGAHRHPPIEGGRMTKDAASHAEASHRQPQGMAGGFRDRSVGWLAPSAIKHHDLANR